MLLVHRHARKTCDIVTRGFRASSSTAMQSTHGEFAQLFDKQADSYAKFRPTYPPALFEAILDFHRAGRAPTCNLAVDIATGSGQAAMGMAPYVKQIIGIDANQLQLAAATTLPPNVEFRLGVAEATGLPPASADIAMCAQALHWYAVDVPVFAAAFHVFQV